MPSSEFLSKKKLLFVLIPFLVLAGFLLAITLNNTDKSNDESGLTEIVQTPDGQEIEIQRDVYSQSRVSYAEGNYEKAMNDSMLIAEDNNIDTESRVRAYVLCIESAVASDNSNIASRCRDGADSIVENLAPQEAVDDWKIIISNAFNEANDPLNTIEDE